MSKPTPEQMHKAGTDMSTSISRSLIADMLESAARQVRAGNRDDSACWRLADAAAMFRELIEQTGADDMRGLDSPTGYGAQLPGRRQKA